MKTRLLFFVLMFGLHLAASAQITSCYRDSTNPVYGVGIGLDTFDFDAIQTAHFKISIDTTDSTNAWMIGNVTKSGFPSAFSGSRAIQTDTAAPYAVGLQSAFYIWRDTAESFGWTPNDEFSISFWHYYDVDSLLDSCMVQATIDSGMSWFNLPYYFFFSYNGSLTGKPNDPYFTHVINFSGKSNGWVKENICFVIPLVKQTDSIGSKSGYRFLFKTDSINTSKPGWMIDDIQLVSPLISPGNIIDISSNPLSISPNPSSSGIVNISYPSNFVQGTITIFDVFGRKLKQTTLQKQIDLQELPAGMYFYKASFKGYENEYSGRLIKQ